MKRRALFVGINNYRNGIQPLSCAKRDADELRILFARAGFATDIMTNEEASGADAVRVRIRAITKDLGPGDLFVFYFAGHGVYRDGRQLLVCADATYATCAAWQSGAERVSPVGTLPLAEVVADTNGSFERAFLLDMCRTDLREGQRGVARCTGVRDLVPVDLPSGRQANWTYFYSCDEGQAALEVPEARRGLFSLALSNVFANRLEKCRRLLLDEKFVGEMENEMHSVARSWHMDSGGQRPHRDPHGDTLVLFDPAWEFASVPVSVPLPSPESAPRPRRRRRVARMVAAVAILLALAAAVFVGRDWFDPVDSLWRPSFGAFSPEGQYERARLYEGRRFFRRRNGRKALAWYREAAENGNAEAQFELGGILRDGAFGQVRNEFEAVEWFRKAADQDHAGALAEMGRYFLLGDAGVPKDKKKFVELIQRSADKDDWLGIMMLGVAHQYGDVGVEKSPVRAEELFRRAAGKGRSEAKRHLALFLLESSEDSDGERRREALTLLREAAEEGDDEARCRYGQILLFGLYGVPEEPSRGLSLLRSAAKNDHGEAQYILARCLLGEEKADVSRNDRKGLEWLRKSAANDHEAAQTFLGDLLFHGWHGLEKDRRKAAEWYRRAAAREHAGAMFMLGVMYNEGLGGLPRDEAKAAERFGEAAARGHAKARNELGIMYECGLGGLPKDEAKAVELYEQAAAQEDADARFSLARMYEDGLGGLPKDEAKAAELYEQAAVQENASAMNNLALMYEDGRGGLPKNAAKAAELYERAAGLGNVNSQFAIGLCYDHGRGVPQNDEKAVAWYRRAAEREDSDAQNNLGRMYETGRGVPQSDEAAVEWYRRAAEQGNKFAQYNLGRMYRDGRGRVPKSDEEAVKWLLKAAGQGHSLAQFLLGGMYETGRGVPKSDEESLRWYLEAAGNGHSEAQIVVGTMFEYGFRVPRDWDQALSWYRKAVERGNSAAQIHVDVLERKMRHRPPVRLADGRWANPDDTTCLFMTDASWQADPNGGRIKIGKLRNLSGWDAGSLQAMVWLCSSYDPDSLFSGVQFGFGSLATGPFRDGDEMQGMDVPFFFANLPATGDYCSVITVNELREDGTWAVASRVNGPRCHWDLQNRWFRILP